MVSTLSKPDRNQGDEEDVKPFQSTRPNWQAAKKIAKQCCEATDVAQDDICPPVYMAEDPAAAARATREAIVAGGTQ
jgi:hypothetical protein